MNKSIVFIHISILMELIIKFAKLFSGVSFYKYCRCKLCLNFRFNDDIYLVLCFLFWFRIARVGCKNETWKRTLINGFYLLFLINVVFRLGMVHLPRDGSHRLSVTVNVCLLDDVAFRNGCLKQYRKKRRKKLILNAINFGDFVVGGTDL